MLCVNQLLPINHLGLAYSATLLLQQPLLPTRELERSSSREREPVVLANFFFFFFPAKGGQSHYHLPLSGQQELPGHRVSHILHSAVSAHAVGWRVASQGLGEEEGHRQQRRRAWALCSGLQAVQTGSIAAPPPGKGIHQVPCSAEVVGPQAPTSQPGGEISARHGGLRL
jgi:hypothetical protein